MSYEEFAKRELAIINKKGDKMQNQIDENILEILKIFSKQGHSGFSAGYIIPKINRLLQFLPLTPLTGEDDEWAEIIDPTDNTVQNKRCPHIFKNLETGKAYNIRGKVFSDDDGKTWFINGDSSVDIEFPYSVQEKPKYFLVNSLGMEKPYEQEEV